MNTKALKQKILDLAIHGKLLPLEKVEKIRKEEPASVLLEKIRAEKQEKIAKGELKKDKNDSFIFLGDDKRHYEKFADGSVKDIEDEIPFEVPEGWAWCRLRNIGEYKKGPFGSSLTKSMFVPKSENTVKVYEQKNAIQKDHSLGEYYITRDYFESQMQSFEVFPGDILVSCAGTIGETYILPDNIEQGIINQALMKMKITSLINTDYFLMFFDHILKEESANNGKGTAIKNIPPFDIFKNFLFPLPPIFEQQKIVHSIQDFFDHICILEQNKTDLQTAIKQVKSKILDLAIHGKLVPQDPNDESASVLLEKIRAEKEAKIAKGELKRDKNDSYIYKGSDNCHYEKLNGKDVCIENELPFAIPDNWQWCRLGECSKVISKGTTPKGGKNAYTADGVNFLRIENLNNNGSINHSNISHISFKEHESNLKRSKLEEGDLLISIAGTLGKVGFVKKSDLPMNTNQAIAFVRLQKNIFDNMFLKYAIECPCLNSNLLSKTKVTSIPNLTLEMISDCFIPLPPITEQQRIVAKIEELISLLDQIQTNLI